MVNIVFSFLIYGMSGKRPFQTVYKYNKDFL